jgi:hypothetical protein
MAHTFVSLDFYNENLSCRINGNSYLFSSVERFNSTGFPFSGTVKILSYEPDRRLYVVEDSNGNVTNDPSSSEIQWIHNNLNTIEQVALIDKELNNPKISAADQRTILLFNTDYVLQRHQEETALNITHTLTDQQFNNVLVYRQALRDLNVHGVAEGTTRTKTIDDVTWPANPLT